ncbi:MAG: imidazolonepropionase [Desulfobacterales bacterium]|jgi:imidazolonepropionase|nr:imidazolonepropionase [Desulfobacterales bacterium]
MNGNIIIKNAAQLVTCSGFKAKKGKEMSDLYVIKDGALVIENGTIQSVGKTGEILANFDEKSIQDKRFVAIDASGKAVLPGFVDSHTHLVFGGYRAQEFSWRLRGDSYMEILKRGGGILNTVKSTRRANKEGLMTTGIRRLNAMLSLGVTTVEGKSGYGLDRDTEIKQLEVLKALNECHPMDVVSTFLGAHALPEEYKGRADVFIDFIIETVLPEVVDRHLAEFCDVFCEKNVFSIRQSKRLLMNAGKNGLKIKIHADEIEPLGGSELAAEIGAVSADHLLQASDKGLRAMAEAGVVATLLPGTAFCLKEPFANGRYMIDNNLAVALATDFNPGSCYSESIPLIFALATLYMNFSIEEAVTALTINGAAALQRADTIGSLDIGKYGDVVILKYPSYQFIPYHVGINTVEKVIKKGELVYDDPLLKFDCP